MNMIVIPHRSIRAMLLGLSLLIGGTLLAPLPSHAIPVAGDYTFTSGLTGTFTSDGTQLTAWNFNDAFDFNWSQTSPHQFEADNSESGFLAGTTSGIFHGIDIYWTLNLSLSRQFNSTGIATFFTFERVSSSVPEPSSVSMAGLGLLLLLGYGWRQRRQAGVQVG